jgi:hypothetical protein
VHIYMATKLFAVIENLMVDFTLIGFHIAKDV